MSALAQAAVSNQVRLLLLDWSKNTVYVGGAGGNVGFAAVQFARAAGARIVASARPADHERCREAGAAVTVDYRDPELTAALRAAAPDGIDVFWDTSGHRGLDLAADLLAPGGESCSPQAAWHVRPCRSDRCIPVM